MLNKLITFYSDKQKMCITECGSMCSLHNDNNCQCSEGILLNLLNELKSYRNYNDIKHHSSNHVLYVQPICYDSDESMYKYACPICNMLGNKHQLHKNEANCPICNVNLAWDDIID